MSKRPYLGDLKALAIGTAAAAAIVAAAEEIGDSLHRDNAAPGPTANDPSHKPPPHANCSCPDCKEWRKAHSPQISQGYDPGCTCDAC